MHTVSTYPTELPLHAYWVCFVQLAAGSLAAGLLSARVGWRLQVALPMRGAGCVDGARRELRKAPRCQQRTRTEFGGWLGVWGLVRRLVGRWALVGWADGSPQRTARAAPPVVVIR